MRVVVTGEGEFSMPVCILCREQMLFLGKVRTDNVNHLVFACAKHKTIEIKLALTAVQFEVLSNAVVDMLKKHLSETDR